MKSIVGIVATLVAVCSTAQGKESFLRSLAKAPKLPKYCKGLSGDPSTKDRFCEANGPREPSRCQCKEVCHIWGDPHVEPFFSGCSAITLSEERWYTILNVPGQIEILAYTERNYVRSVKIGENGEVPTEVFNHLNCDNSRAGFENNYHLKSSATGNKVVLSFETHCETHTPNAVNLDWHLNTTIEMNDDCPEHEGDVDDDKDDDDDDDNVDAERCAKFQREQPCENNGCEWYNDEQCIVPGSADASSSTTDCSLIEKKQCKAKTTDGKCSWNKKDKACEEITCTTLNKKSCKKVDSCIWHPLSGCTDVQINAAGEEIPDATKFGTVPPSINSFPEAFGACTNPCSAEAYAVEGGKPTLAIDQLGASECRLTAGGSRLFWEQDYGSEGCPARDDSWDGRKVSCNAECSAYGDPYVTDFFTDQPTTRGCNLRTNCFMIFPGDDEESQEMYFLEGKFQFLVQTDECQYITGATARYTVNERGDYYEAQYYADEECGTEFGGAMISSEGRPIVTLPAKINSETAVSGSLTTNQRSNMAIDSVVYNSRVNGFHLGEAPSSIGVIDAGGVRVVLKCHNTKEKKGYPSKAYFNVCIHRSDVEPVDGDAGSSVAASGISLQQLEADLHSRGHCALGSYNKRKGYANRPDPSQISQKDFVVAGASKLDPPSL